MTHISAELCLEARDFKIGPRYLGVGVLYDFAYELDKKQS